MYSYLDDEEEQNKPDLRSYLAEKHNLDPQTMQPREAAQKQYDEQVDRSNTANLFANLGDVFAGKRPGQSNQFFSDLNKQVKENTIGKLDSDRKRQMEDLTFANSQKKSQHENDLYDPNTATSQSFRKMIEAKFPEVAKVYGDSWQNVTAADQENIFKPLQLKEQIDSRKQIAALAAQEKQKAANEKKAEKDLKNSPEERLKNLSGTDKARYDNALMVLKGLDDMGQALDNNQNTFSMVGDNDYTAASRRATEGYGRMQSGGAINKEEEAKFEKTLPRSLDTKQIQRKKILDQRAEMISRLHTLGFSPEQAKYAPRDFKYGGGESAAPSLGTIEDGHKFKGGDPADPKNWEQL